MYSGDVIGDFRYDFLCRVSARFEAASGDEITAAKDFGHCESPTKSILRVAGREDLRNEC